MSKPVAVIRKVEDSPDWLDRRLVEAYLNTIYRVSHFDINIGQPHLSFEKWLNECGAQTYAIITAWNPASQLLPLTENQLKNKELEADLQKVARFVVPAMNAPVASDWPPEESFWACDMDAENAVLLGIKYGQNAIVWWGKGGIPELWWLIQ